MTLSSLTHGYFTWKLWLTNEVSFLSQNCVLHGENLYATIWQQWSSFHHFSQHYYVLSFAVIIILVAFSPANNLFKLDSAEGDSAPFSLYMSIRFLYHFKHISYTEGLTDKFLVDMNYSCVVKSIYFLG